MRQTVLSIIIIYIFFQSTISSGALETPINIDGIRFFYCFNVLR